MGFSFIPREEKFFDMFERAAKNVEVAARLFRNLAEDWNLKDPKIQQIRELEHEGDIVTHEIMDKLNRTFITPIDREDIHALTGKLDDIIDLIQAITDRMFLYNINKTDKELTELARILETSVEEVNKAITGLRDFGRSRRILDYCIEINRLENEGDHVLKNAIAKLFKESGEPLEVMKWKEIYEVTETAIDKCEDVANIIEGIVVKHG